MSDPLDRDSLQGLNRAKLEELNAEADAAWRREDEPPPARPSSRSRRAR